MKKISYIFLLLLIVSSCVKTGPLPDDFTEVVYSPHHATGFTIRRVPGAESTLLEVTDPWQGADSVSRFIFIARGGETPPRGIMSVNGGAVRVVCMSTSQIGLLAAFGADSLVAGVSGMDYVTDPVVKLRRDEIADVGFEGAVDYERLISVKPDLVLLYGVGGPSAMEEKLAELGIPYIYIGDYLEQSPLGRAEWMVALGELTGRRSEAEMMFAPIAAAYDSIRTSIGQDGYRPRVMLNAPYSDAWFMPPVTSYMVRLVSESGGEYVYPENKSGISVPIDMEIAAGLIGDSDLWLQPGQARSLAELRSMSPKISFDGPVFNSVADFWESGVARPDLVLADLNAIMNGEAADSVLTYFYRLK